MPQSTVPRGIYLSSSRGEIVIADMGFVTANNARNALMRREPERTQEIEDLTAHLADLKVKYEASLREVHLNADTTPERRGEIERELERLASEG